MPRDESAVADRRAMSGPRWALPLALALAVIASAPAHAAFPGVPGPIAYSKLRLDEASGDSGGLLAHGPRVRQKPRRLTSDPSDSSPSYSPDGRQVVFVRSSVTGLGSSIYLMNAGGGEAKALTLGIDSDANPSFSRSGQQVVFDRHPVTGGPSHLFVVKVDGTGLRQLTKGPASDSDPTFTPNGKRIVFTSNRDKDARTDRGDIFSMSPSGTEIRVLVDGPFTESEPDVSPNGRRVVFASNRNSGPNVFTAKLNGGGVRQLTNSRRGCFSGACYTSPSWAPDGRHIALLTIGRYNSDLEVIRPDGSGGKEFADAGTETEGFGSKIGAPGWGPAPR